MHLPCGAPPPKPPSSSARSSPSADRCYQDSRILSPRASGSGGGDTRLLRPRRNPLFRSLVVLRTYTDLLAFALSLPRCSGDTLISHYLADVEYLARADSFTVTQTADRVSPPLRIRVSSLSPFLRWSFLAEGFTKQPPGVQPGGEGTYRFCVFCYSRGRRQRKSRTTATLTKQRSAIFSSCSLSSTRYIFTPPFSFSRVPSLCPPPRLQALEHYYCLLLMRDRSVGTTRDRVSRTRLVRGSSSRAKL